MSVRFDSATDRLLLTSSLLDYNAPYTLMGWFYLSSDLNAAVRIFSLNNNSGNNEDSFGTDTDGTTLLNRVSNSAAATSATGTNIAINTWHHVALVRESVTSLKVYLDGVLDSTNTRDVTGRSTITRLEIGARGTANAAPLDGRVGYLKAWSAALAQADVQQEMNVIRPIQTANLYAFWPTFAGVGEHNLDYSGNGHAFTEGGTLTDEDSPPVSYGSAPRFAVDISASTATVDVVMTVNSGSAVIARTVPAISLIDGSPDWTFATGWANAKVNIRKAVGAIKEHIFPFGLLDPQPTSTSAIDFVTGNRLATGMAKLREASDTADAILTLYHGTWWMMDKYFNGTVTPMVSSEAYDDAGRVRWDNLPDWLALVDKAVELCAAAPYSCRNFEIWNEGKGYYYSPGTSGSVWDASMHKGDGIDSVVMGYGYFFLRTAQQVVATMTRLGIARNQYRIGAPYPVLATFPTTSGAIPSTHPLYQYGTVWGYMDKAPINFTNAFLDNFASGAIPYDLLDTFLIDCSTFIKFPTGYTPTDADFPSLDPFDYTGKYTPIFEYWKAQLAAKGFDSDMPFSVAEIYASPEPDSLQSTAAYADQQGLRAALWADVLRQCYLERILHPISWGSHGTASANADQGGIITDPALGASGGLLTKTGVVYQLFKDNFPPGTPLYTVTSSDNRAAAIANPTFAILYNKTATVLPVSLNGVRLTLQPYDVVGTTYAQAFIGSATVTLPSLVATGTGTRTTPSFSGTAAVTLPSLTAAATGNFTTPAYSGTGTVVLPSLVASGEGSVDVPAYSGDAAVLLASLIVDATGDFVPPAFSGSADMTLPSLVVEALGLYDVPAWVGSADVMLPALSASGEGDFTKPAYDGAAIVTLPSLVVDSTGEFIPPALTGEGGVTLPMLIVAAFGRANLPVVPLFVEADVEMIFQRRAEVVASPSVEASVETLFVRSALVEL